MTGLQVFVDLNRSQPPLLSLAVLSSGTRLLPMLLPYLSRTRSPVATMTQSDIRRSLESVLTENIRFAYLLTHTHTHTHKHIRMFVYVCICVCVYIYIYTHTSVCVHEKTRTGAEDEPIYPEDGGRSFLRYVVNYLPKYTVTYLTIHSSSS